VRILKRSAASLSCEGISNNETMISSPHDETARIDSMQLLPKQQRVNAYAITPKEAMPILGVGSTRLYTLVENKRIPHRREGRRILFRLTDLLEYVENQTIRPR
jgi:excisionase family DNA binding protein